MKISAIVLFYLLSFSAFSQDTIYLDSNWQRVNSISEASYYNVLYRDQKDNNKVRKLTYTKSGIMKSDISYSNYEKSTLNGRYILYFENGKIKKETVYVDNLKDGNLLTFWENGNPKRKDQFKKGEFVSGKCFDKKGKEIPHFDYEVAAEYPGGIHVLLQYVATRLMYPEDLMMDGIEGRVMVKFVVDVDGSVTNVTIATSTNEKFEPESIRVVKSLSKWKPAYQDGEPIRSNYVLPVRFAISD